MKFTIFILFACFMQVAAKVNAQISISDKNVPITSVLAKIQQQSGYNLFYENTKVKDVKISVNLNNVSLAEALDRVLKDQELTYALVDKTIVIKIKTPSFLDRLVDAFTPPIDVRGTVVDEKGMPLPGANVKVKGFKQAAVTDNEGRFYLLGVDDKAILIVSFVGYKDVEVGVKASLSIALEMKSSELDEVVVAYGKTTQKALTGAVTVVKGEEIQNLPNRSVDKSLQGLVPGLLVTSGTGQPGGGLSNFVLRGIATGSSNGLLDGFSTLRNPLIVIDGIPVSQEPQQLKTSVSITNIPTSNPMAQINPSDIENISILKDASAIALYGSKASNGVILITTKKGKEGKTRVSIRSQVDVASRINPHVELLNETEYLTLLYETYRNTNASVWTDVAILADLKSKFPTRSDGSFYPFTKIEDLIFNQNATTSSNDLSISGGNEKSSFYLGLEWTKENGIYNKTGYDRKSIRYNFDNRIANWFKIGMNTGLSYNVQDYAASTAAKYGTVFYANPLNPIYLENGDYYLNYKTPQFSVNPVAAVDYNSSRNISYRGLSKLYGELSFSKQLKFTSNVGIDFQSTEAKEKQDPRFTDGQIRTTGVGRIYEGNLSYANLINTNILSYSKAFNSEHELSLLAGHEAQILTQRNVTASGSYLYFYTYDQIDQTANRTSSGTAYKQTAVSYFGQANYSYRNKYFLSASARTDGSSTFGEKQRFGTYWSTGAGWIVSGEKFMNPIEKWINYLKIRGSIGSAGNAGSVGRYTQFDRLNLPINYLNVSTIAVLPEAPANALIKPEQTFTWDAGLEMKLFAGRVNITADIYHRKTSDLIFPINVPYVSGYINVTANIGDMVNRGTEISLATDIVKAKNFRWNLNVNWSTNQNKLVKANLPLTTVVGSQLANAEGENFNSFYMPVWAGVDAATGNGQWIDSTGKANIVYSAAKLQFVGKPQPDGFGAISNTLSYKGISLSFQFYYQYGFQIYNTGTLINDGGVPYDNQEKGALNRWQKPGDNALNPKRTLNNAVFSRVSTRNLVNGDFIRLQNVGLNYNFSPSFAQRLHLSYLSVYLQGYNLALWTTSKQNNDISNVNVQGQLSAQYPTPRSFSLGLKASL